MKPSALLCFLAAAACAALPLRSPAAEKFSFRGTLERTDGAAFATGIPMQMTFRLYDCATGGIPLWGRTLPVRVEADGAFYAELSDDEGSASDDSLPCADLASALAIGSGGFWIGLSPEGYSEMAPRQRLATVPRALRAVSAERIAAVRTDSLKAGAVLAGEATIGHLTVTNSFDAPETATLAFPDGGTLYSGALNLRGGFTGIRETVITNFSGSFRTNFHSDSFVLAYGVTNADNPKSWSCVFVPASEDPVDTGLYSPKEVHIYSLGRMD